MCPPPFSATGIAASRFGKRGGLESVQSWSPRCEGSPCTLSPERGARRFGMFPYSPPHARSRRGGGEGGAAAAACKGGPRKQHLIMLRLPCTAPRRCQPRPSCAERTEARRTQSCDAWAALTRLDRARGRESPPGSLSLGCQGLRQSLLLTRPQERHSAKSFEFL